MAQWTVAMDASVRRGDGTCEVRVRTSRVDGRGQPLYVTMVVRDGDTIRSDDPLVTAAFDGMRAAGNAKVVSTLAVRPPAPTYDVDARTAEPLPERVSASGERTR
jgi:hypothetical protein